MGIGARVDVQPLGYSPGAADPEAEEIFNANFSNPPVMSLTGAPVPFGLGVVAVTVLDDAGTLKFQWTSTAGYGNAAGQVILADNAPVELLNISGSGPSVVGLEVAWSEGDPYADGDEWEFSDVVTSGATPTETSSPPTLAATSELTLTRTVQVEVTYGTPGYRFSYTLGSSPAREADMDRGTAVPLLEEDDSLSGLTITWPLVTTLYPGATYSWAVTASTLTLTSPADGATLTGGTTHRVVWTDDGDFPLGVDLELSLDGGTTWETIRAGMEATGSYVWPVPVADGAALVRVVDAAGSGINDVASVTLAREANGRHGWLLAQLLPRGSVWKLEAGSYVRRLLQGVGDELHRVEIRGTQLIDESDPRTAYETLPEWETQMGLPDDAVTAIPSTVAQRRQAIVSKLLREGGQHAGFFVSLAAACGYTVTVVDDYGETVARAGRARAGDRARGVEWAHTWEVVVQPPTGPALTHAELEAIVRRAAPAHAATIFTYL